MRRGVQYALGVTLALTVFALWRPKAPAVVAVINRNVESRLPVWAEGTGSPQRSPVLARLPSELQVVDSEPARRDVFAPVEVVQKKPPRPVAVVMEAPPPPPPPPAPSAPPANYRFLGRMVTPSGETLVYLASGVQVIAVRVGERLDSGYVVESVNSDNVLLVYPPLGAKVAIPLPAGPAS